MSYLSCAHTAFAMAPHLTAKEKDFLRALLGKGLSLVQIHAKFVARRARSRTDALALNNLRRVLKGETYRQGLCETRGLKRKLTPRAVRKLNKTRKELIKKAAGEEEVHWDDILRKPRVQKVDPTTAARAVRRVLPGLQWRAPREKPTLSKQHKAERLAICTEWQSLPSTYFAKTVDLVIDNKKFTIPTHKNSKAHLKMTKVRGHLCTRGEGLKSGFTKPNCRKHKSNPGAYVNICAGLTDGKVRMWHELPSAWNGEVAEKLYRGPVIDTLRAHRGHKRRYTILEDNDPVGYKSNKAKVAQLDFKIGPVRFPKYSPDLNPLDFYVWSEIERRMLASRVKGVESAKQYKSRLRRVAMSLPRREPRAH